MLNNASVMLSGLAIWKSLPHGPMILTRWR